jgi:hypothetical protein
MVILSQLFVIARMFHELLWRDHKDGRARVLRQGVVGDGTEDKLER